MPEARKTGVIECSALFFHALKPHMAGMDQSTPLIFDRRAVKRNRARSARAGNQANFLFEDVAKRLIDRRFDVKRAFDTVAVIGGRGLISAAALDCTALLHLDPCADLLPGGVAAVCDEEALALREGCFDAVFSLLHLHSVNDLPGALIQINRALKPDGLFMGAVFAAGTADTLKQAFLQADLDTTGTVKPRIAPLLDVRDAGGLLQRAGFQMPVADTETVTVNYRKALSCFTDLRHMGEANALTQRSKSLLGKATLAACLAQLEGRRNTAGKIPIAFNIAFMTGWAPGPNQPRPLRPGSAKARLADALGTTETPLHEA
ncbi:MAG: methyltransferase domain-containing protein [Pseudomonadota bacterium]